MWKMLAILYGWDRKKNFLNKTNSLKIAQDPMDPTNIYITQYGFWTNAEKETNPTASKISPRRAHLKTFSEELYNSLHPDNLQPVEGSNPIPIDED